MPVTDNEPAPPLPQQPPPPAAVPPQPNQPQPNQQQPSQQQPVVQAVAPVLTGPAIAAPHVPAVAALDRAPFSRTIRVLALIAVLLGLAMAAMVLYDQLDSADPIITTQGGALIKDFDALDDTEMAAPFNAIAALDQDVSTSWGLVAVPGGTPIVGTSYVIKLTEEQNVVSVGIVHGNDPTIGRVDQLLWGTRLIDGRVQGPLVLDQSLTDTTEPQRIDFAIRTNQIVLVIAGTQDDDAVNAAVAEILIEVQP